MFKHTGTLRHLQAVRRMLNERGAAPARAGGSVLPGGLQARKELDAEVKRLVRLAAKVGDLDSYGGKRGKRRIREGLRLEFAADPAVGEDVKVAFMHDISETGMALWSKTPIELHSVVYVREYSEEQVRPWLKARVTRCGPGIRGFFLGCAFEFSGPVTAPAEGAGR